LQAATAYKDALSLCPSHVPATVGLAELYLVKGKTDMAIDW